MAEIAPGRYQAAPLPSRVCFWYRLRGFSGENKDVIASGAIANPDTVTIDASDVGFNTQGCQDWTPA